MWNTINQFLVKEHVGMFKAANNFDLFDLNDNSHVLQCREDKLGILTKLLRFTDYKRMTPFHIDIRDMNGNIILTVKRGVSIFVSMITVYDGSGQIIGYFKQKLFSVGGKFIVMDAKEMPICVLQGKWTGWDFHFKEMESEKELAHVTKKWAGLGKELFTSADNYVLDIFDSVPADSDIRKLILAAVMCIDMVFKE